MQVDEIVYIFAHALIANFMKKMTNYLVQPTMRRLFYSENLLLTEKAGRILLQIHLALGGHPAEYGECSGVLSVRRGEIYEWRSFADATAYDSVASVDEYKKVWEECFPTEMKLYTFVTRNTPDGLSLKISDGDSEVLMSTTGEYMIPLVYEVLQSALCAFVLKKPI